MARPIYITPPLLPEPPRPFADTNVDAGLWLRFWLKVLIGVKKADWLPTDCWEWIGAVDSDGYGQFWDGTRMVHAHRVAYTMFYGEIPAGLDVCHTCNWPPCVRPDHLYPGTAGDNLRYMAECGRSRGGRYRAGESPLSQAVADDIRLRHEAGESCRSLAAAFGVSYGAIRAIVEGRTWREPGCRSTDLLNLGGVADER